MFARKEPITEKEIENIADIYISNESEKSKVIDLAKTVFIGSSIKRRFLPDKQIKPK